GRVAAVISRTADGGETATPARTVIVDLGLAARDLLGRMAEPGAPVRVVGPAADEPPLPAAPSDRAAVVCRCMGVTVGDLEEAGSSGYPELELLKRASLAGIGT